jgi:HAMP domain-containing protein
LLPLSLPPLWQAVHVWDKSPWAATVSLAVVVALFAFLRWLNVTRGVDALLATRANVEAMFPGI